MVFLTIPPRITELRPVATFMVLFTFFRFVLNAEDLAVDHFMALPSLLPPAFFALCERKGAIGVQWLALMVASVLVLALELSNMWFYSSLSLNKVILIDLVASIFSALPAAVFGYKGYALLKDALTQSAIAGIAAGDLRLDHYRLI